MTKLEIIELIVIAVIALAIAIYYIVMAIKNGWLKQLTATINEAIVEAEKSGKSGAEKKAYVIEKVREKCLELGIPYDLLKKLISKLIDKIVANYNVIAKGDK